MDKKWKLWGRRISYIDSSTFVSTIINMLGKVSLTDDENITDKCIKIKAQIQLFKAGTLQQIMQTLASESKNLKTFETNLTN